MKYSTNIVKPVYKDYAREHENVAFMSSFPLFALFINGEIVTALYRKVIVLYRYPLRQALFSQ